MPGRPEPSRFPAPAPDTGAGGILRRYAGLPWPTRLFLFLRWTWTPYLEMASLLPMKGRILDGGSGHGLFSLALAVQSKRRRVEGLEHSPVRVAMARKAAAGLPNVGFKEADFRNFSPGPYDGIAFVDVLHYLSYADQEKLLLQAFRRLRPGGTLIFRDVDRRPGLSSLWNRLHEAVMTRLGFTRAGGLHFRPAEGWARLAEKSGYQVSSKPTGRFPFADVLFYCEKPTFKAGRGI